ncbi:MAG: hypothetical protein KA248_00160 [Kiritimatiellae bacterium]|nr:hypothetical protein [Kiritimatiellia bacterium]
MSLTVHVKGWQAAALLLAVLGLWLFARARAYRTLDTEAVEAIRPWLAAAYMWNALGEADRPFERMTASEQKAFSDKVLAAGRVRITSIRARGSGDHIVCRVEVSVDGQPPSDGKTVRYYAMRYSSLTGWTYEDETSPLLYYLTLF